MLLYALLLNQNIIEKKFPLNKTLVRVIFLDALSEIANHVVLICLYPSIKSSHNQN